MISEFYPDCRLTGASPVARSGMKPSPVPDGLPPPASRPRDWPDAKAPIAVIVPCQKRGVEDRGGLTASDRGARPASTTATSTARCSAWPVGTISSASPSVSASLAPTGSPSSSTRLAADRPIRCDRTHQTSVGEQPQAGKRKERLCAFCHDDYVAGRHQPNTNSGRRAFNGGDHGFRGSGNQLHQRPEPAHPFIAVFHRHRRHRGKVSAGAERAACPGED